MLVIYHNPLITVELQCTLQSDNTYVAQQISLYNYRFFSFIETLLSAGPLHQQFESILFACLMLLYIHIYPDAGQPRSSW